MAFVRTEAFVHVETDGIDLTEKFRPWGVEIRNYTYLIPRGVYGTMPIRDASHYIFHDGMELTLFCSQCIANVAELAREEEENGSTSNPSNLS
jgi:hypothetical protein